MTMINTTIAGKELLWFNNTLVAIQLSSADGEDGICIIEHRQRRFRAAARAPQ